MKRLAYTRWANNTQIIYSKTRTKSRKQINKLKKMNKKLKRTFKIRILKILLRKDIKEY
jgi:hypothetical protein